MTNLVSKDELDRMFADYNDELANKTSSINGGGNMRRLRSQAYKKRKTGTIRAAGISDHNGHRIRNTRSVTRNTRARRTFNGGGEESDKYDPNKKIKLGNEEYTQAELLRMTNAPPGYTARTPALDRYFKSLYGQNKRVQPTREYDSGEETDVAPSVDGPFNGGGGYDLGYDPNKKVKIGDEEYTQQELIRMTNVPPGYTARTPALDRYFKNLPINKQVQQSTYEYESGDETDVIPSINGGGDYDPNKKVKIGDEEYTQQELLRMTNVPPGYTARTPALDRYFKNLPINKQVQQSTYNYDSGDDTDVIPPINGGGGYDPNKKIKIGNEEYTQRELLRMTNAPSGYNHREPLNSYFKRRRDNNKYNPNEKVRIGDREYTQQQLVRMTNDPSTRAPRKPFSRNNVIPGGGIHKSGLSDDDILNDMHRRYGKHTNRRNKVLYPTRLRGGAVAGRKNSVIFD